jgi:HAD superfamily hydrolase (TIGR01458 family)
MTASLDVDALLLDIDGVLVTSWQAVPGAIEAVETLRAHGVPLRLITNTTTHTRVALAETLAEAGFSIAPDEIATAVTATASYLQAEHPGAGVFVLSDGDPGEDLGAVRIVDVDDAEVVVLGGGCDDFSYDAMNRVFRRVHEGAAFVAMHRNMYWRATDGLQLDGGAFVAALEAATGVVPAVCGKPSLAFFASALAMLGVAPPRVAMVGDDVVNDVTGAQEAGLTGVLVRTGKFRPDDVDRGEPDAVVDSLADVPSLIGLEARA